MRWVREDYEALADFMQAANRWGGDETALSPGKLVRRLRRGLRVSQRQLAAQSGVARSLVARLESGGDVSVGSLKRLLEALGCGLIVLPASAPLLERFRSQAKEERRIDREWNRMRRKLQVEGGSVPLP